MTYLDASALVSVFMPDIHTDAVRGRLRRGEGSFAASPLGFAEFASAVSLRVRTGAVASDRAEDLLSVFDAWTARALETLEQEPADYRVAAGFVRRFDLGLRAPDALHVALCRRLGLSLVTFDRRQATAAIRLGVACETFG